MDARYQRNIPALSADECALLAEKRVLIAGCGGLGGHLVELCTRIGIGALRVVDGDVFEATNLNRQLLCTETVLGTSKARAAQERAQSINPAICVEALETTLDAANADALVTGCDAVLDALDSIESRRILAAAADSAGLPYVYGAIHGWVAQAALSLPGDQLIDSLYPTSARLGDKSVLAFTPALCAAMQVALCVKQLVGRPVAHATLYYVDLLSQEFETLPLH